MNRERLLQRVSLRGLSEEDVGRFIEVAAGIVPPGGLVEAVYGPTEGNPLFVTEMVRLVVQEGELAADVRAARESWDVRVRDLFAFPFTGESELLNAIPLQSRSTRCDRTRVRGKGQRRIGDHHGEREV